MDSGRGWIKLSLCGCRGAGFTATFLQHISVSNWGYRDILSPVHHCTGLIFKVSQGERSTKTTQLGRWIKEELPPASSGFCISSGTRPGLSWDMQHQRLSPFSSPKGNCPPCPDTLLLHPSLPSPSLCPDGTARRRRAVRPMPCFIYLKSCNIYINKLLMCQRIVRWEYIGKTSWQICNEHRRLGLFPQSWF